jgi:Ca2+-binding RTX toxin-like protein
MDGGAGNDTYVVNSRGDSVTETLAGAAGGTDLVRSAAAIFVLGNNVENLTLTEAGNINGAGNALNNILTGNSGDNVLSGGDGTDTLIGGAGNDTLDGGAGTDKMAGGLGDDTYTVDLTTDVVTEALNAGTDKVFSSITYTLGANVENLRLTGTDNLTGTGNALTNILTGNSGNNTLSGLAGNDTLRGGLGNDTVNGGAGNDTFDFGLGDGQDLIQDISGSTDKISFDGGINPLDLVISRQANDLRLAIHGSSDQITVQNWYTSSVNRTETIQAGNGQTLLSTQVDQLIQAMAGFTATTGLTWDAASGGAGDPGQQAQFQGIIAANWQ